MSMASFRSLRWVDYIFLAILDPRSLGRLLNARGFLLPTLILPAAVAITEILCLSRFGHQSGFFLYKISYGWIFLFILIVGFIYAYAKGDLYWDKPQPIIPKLERQIFKSEE